MQEAVAKTKFARISPRKVRPYAAIIRGMSAEKALVQLSYTKSKGARMLKKTLVSAIANAETRFDGIQRRDLAVKEVRIDQGPVLKRAKSKCRGGRVPILKRMSHFTIVVVAA
ncbi:MAG: 50S ribosomal protein L22 [Chlamydiota bacterium]